MADLQKTVAIVFNAVDNTGGALDTIGGNISSFADGLQSAIAPLDAIAGYVKMADTAIVGFGVALGVKAVEAAGRFEGSMNEIGTLFGANAEQLGAYSNQVLDYASGSTQSLDSVTAALYNAVSAGVDWSNSVEFMATVEKLAVAGKADLNQVTLALTGTMNAYGASADEASQYSDYLMKTVQLGQTNLTALAGSLGQVTSTAAAAGIGFDEVAAAVAALTANGIPTEQAMTALKGAISNILKPTSEAEKAAADLGIQFDAQALKSKGLSGVMQEVYEATGGNVEQMARLFGSMEGLKAATALGADNSGIYGKALEQMGTSAGTTADAFKLMENNFDLMTQRLKNGVEVLLVSVGTPLKEQFGGLVDELQDILSGARFAVTDGAFDQVFEAFGRIFKDLEGWLRQLADNLPAALAQVDFSKFASSIENLAGSFGGLFDGIDVSTPEGLAKSIQTVVDVIANLLNQGAGIVQTWDAWMEKAAPLVQAFADMSEGTATAQGKLLGLADVFNVLLPAIGAVGDGIQSIGTAFELIASVQLAKFITGASSAKEALALINTAAAGTGTALAGAAGTGGLVLAAGAAGYAVGTVLADGIDWVGQKLSGNSGWSLGGAIYDLANGSDDLAVAAPKAGEGVKKIGEAAEKVKPPLDQLDEGLKKAAKEAEDAGNYIGGKFVQSVMQAGYEAGEAATKAEFLAAAQKAIKEPTEANIKAMNEAAGAYKDTAQWAGDTAEAAKAITEQYDKLHPAATTTNDKLKTSAGVMEELAGKTDLTNKELIELAKHTKQAELELAKLASNENIKAIEAKVKLDVAELEANSKVAQEMIKGISQTYSANVGLIGNLMSQVTDGYSMADQVRLRLVDDANQRANELHAGQMALIDNQIEYMQRKTSAMAAGNPVMTINATGLQPHLEAMMWEVFKQIQVRMAQDGGDMLVGGCSI